MRFRGHAFIDWDDTVAENIRYFRQAEEEVSRQIAGCTGLDALEIRQRGEQIDVSTARRLGLVKDAFGIAWVDCYREFCQRANLSPDPAVESEIRQACLFPFEVKQELLPGAADALRWLRDSGFEVTIWTAGEQSIQQRKVQESGLETLVHQVVVVPDKDPVRLRHALAHRLPEHSFVVGNSLHSDIRPALALGVLALHVAKETWAYDQEQLDLNTPTYRQVAHIGEVPPLLAKRFDLAV